MIALINLIAGFRDSLSFSNWPTLIFQRVVCRGVPIVTYQWKRQWLVTCDARFGDLNSPKELLARGAYDPYIRSSIRSGALNYVNVGANIGVFDIAVATFDAISHHAIAMELHPLTYGRFIFNLRSNRLDHVKAMNFGIAKSEGTIHIAETTCAHSDSIFSKPEGDTKSGGIECHLLSLEKSLEMAGAEQVNFQLLKLDCEGAEYEIVDHTTAETLSRFENIVMELHPAPHGASAQSLFSKLAQTGFICQMADHVPDKNGLLFWKRSLEK